MHAVSFCVLQQEHLREEHNASVRHGVRQAQNAAAHDGVAQVEDWHSKGGMTGMLLGEKTMNKGEISTMKTDDCLLKYNQSQIVDGTFNWR